MYTNTSSRSISGALRARAQSLKNRGAITVRKPATSSAQQRANTLGRVLQGMGKKAPAGQSSY